MKYLITIPALCLALAILALAQINEVLAGNFPVETVLAGMRISTPVDSAAAREILLSHDPNTLPDEHRCQSMDDIPTLTRQRELTRDHSIDTVTALLIRCLTGIPEIRLTQAMFVSELEARREHSPAQAAYLSSMKAGYLILFVPGWGYLSDGEETGANLQQPREIINQLGYETSLVPLKDFGSVEENAEILAVSLRTHLQRGKKVLLASASSGGPAVALALMEPDIAAHPLLAGWLNINGVLRGSPVVDRFLPWPKSLVPRVLALFEGWRYDELLSLSQAKSSNRFNRFRAPPQLVILNYTGVPFSAQVSRNGRPLYRLLTSSGPNDGLTLVTESLAPGYTILAVGSDHFLGEDPEIGLKTVALLPVLLKLIEWGEPRQRGITQTAFQHPLSSAGSH